MIAHDALNNHHTQPAAFGFGGVIGLIDGPQVFRIDARSIILHHHTHKAIRTLSLQLQNTAILHRLKRILDHIKKYLLHLRLIHSNRRNLFRKLRFNQHTPIADFMLHHPQRILDQLAQPMRLTLRNGRSQSRKKLTDNGIQPLHLLSRNLNQLLQFSRRLLIFQVANFTIQELEMNIN